MQREAMLYESLDSGRIQCHLCRHGCRIKERKFGTCRVRQHLDGRLVTHAWGEVVAARADPIEKKPLYHFVPGTQAYSIGVPGCNFQCSFCQNWQISQAPRDDQAGYLPRRSLSPDDAVSAARELRCDSVAYTYTEPTIFYEYAHDIAQLARQQGMGNLFVTNGFMTREALEAAAPWLDACNVDLKAFDESFYHDICKAKLEPVLDNIRFIRQLGIWLEVTTLIVPGQNDSLDQLKGIAGFLADVDPSVPWHLSRFHPAYQVGDIPATPVDTLHQARDIGREAGLKYIYLGNVPGEDQSTQCPACGRTVISRALMSRTLVDLDGTRCPGCGEPIAGVFELPRDQGEASG